MKTELVALGTVALLAQVALLRELSVAFFGSELILILALGVWLLAVGAGALAPGFGRSRPWDPARAGHWFTVLAVALPVVLAVMRNLRPLLGALPGAYPALGGMLLAVPVLLFPAAAPVGLLFRELAAEHVRRGGTLARAYALESGGSLLGGALATGLLLAGVSNLAVLWLAAVIAAVAGAWRFRGTGKRISLAPVLVLLLLSLGPWLNRLDARLTALEHPDLLAIRDTPYGRLTLLEHGEQKVVLVNDALTYEDQGTDTERFVQVAALQVARPDSVLVLGGAARGVVGGLLQHQPLAVTCVELDERAFRLERSLLSPDDTAGLEDPRVRVLYGDPRALLREMGRFDLILLGMPQPDSGLSNRYYTREFFSLCAAHLRPRGVLAFSLRAAENYWTPLLTWRNACLLKSLRQALPAVTILPGTTSLVLAGRSSLPGPEILADRFNRRGIQARLVGPAYLRYLYGNDRRQAIAARLAAVNPPPNTDLHPVCYQYSLALWLSRFHRGLAEAGWWRWRPGPGIRLPALGGALLLVLVAVLTRRRRSAAGGPGLVLVAGWYGMLLESVLVLGYQTASGVLYRDLGLLLTMFMGGLTAGAWLPDHVGRRGSGRGPVRLVLILAAVPAVLTVVMTPGGGGLLVTSLLLVACGAATGALFALAAAAGGAGRKSPTGIGSLYAVDLLGGCLGSILGSLLLMPVLGLGVTALVAGASALLLALLV